VTLIVLLAKLVACCALAYGWSTVVVKEGDLA